MKDTSFIIWNFNACYMEHILHISIGQYNLTGSIIFIFCSSREHSILYKVLIEILYQYMQPKGIYYHLASISDIFPYYFSPMTSRDFMAGWLITIPKVLHHTQGYRKDLEKVKDKSLEKDMTTLISDHAHKSHFI